MLTSSWMIGPPGQTGSRRNRSWPWHAGGLRRGFTLVELSIVMLVMGMMTIILISMARSFSMLRTSQEEAQTLAQIYTFARRAAIKSGDTVSLDLDLDAETYVLYRVDRSGRKPEKKPIFEERSLSGANSLVETVSTSGVRVATGHVVIPFFPDGTTEEVSILLGTGPGVDVKKTIVFPRFSVSARVEEGEVLPDAMPDEETAADEKRLLDREAR